MLSSYQHTREHSVHSQTTSDFVEMYTGKSPSLSPVNVSSKSGGRAETWQAFYYHWSYNFFVSVHDISENGVFFACNIKIQMQV